MNSSIKPVRSLNTINGGESRVIVFSDNNQAISKSDNAISVSKISIPNLPTEFIDEKDSNLGHKAKLLFERMKDLIIAQGLVITFSEGNANKLQHSNNLKQLSLGVHTRVQTINLTIGTPAESHKIVIRLENTLITNYSIHVADSGNQPLGEGKKVNITFVKS